MHLLIAQQIFDADDSSRSESEHEDTNDLKGVLIKSLPTKDKILLSTQTSNSKFQPNQLFTKHHYCLRISNLSIPNRPRLMTREHKYFIFRKALEMSLDSRVDQRSPCTKVMLKLLPCSFESIKGNYCDVIKIIKKDFNNFSLSQGMIRQ